MLTQSQIITELSKLIDSSTLTQHKALSTAIDIIRAVGNDFFCGYCKRKLPKEGYCFGQGHLTYCCCDCLLKAGDKDCTPTT